MAGKTFKIMLVLLLLLSLPGCYNYNEPDEIAWVLALGLDRGRENILTVTAVIAVPKDIAGAGGGEAASGGGSQGGFFTVSLEAPTLLSSLELLNAVVDRRVNLSHTTWFIFSRELAEQGINRYFAPIARFYQFRRTSHVVTCEGRADEFLTRGRPVMESNVSKYYELLQLGWKYTEFIPRDNFHTFYYEAHSIGVAPVTFLAALEKDERVFPDNSPKPKGEYEAGRLPRRGGGKIELMGAAVYKKGVMVGTLDADELGIRKMFNNTFKRTIMDVPDPNHPGKFIIMEVNPRTGPDIDISIDENGYPVIKVHLRLEGEVISIQSGTHYETPENIGIIEAAVEKKVMKDIAVTINKSKELEADFFGFGLQAKKLFPTWPRWEAYRWDEKYPQADIEVTVDYRVRRTGLLHEMAPIR